MFRFGASKRNFSRKSRRNASLLGSLMSMMLPHVLRDCQSWYIKHYQSNRHLMYNEQKTVAVICVSDFGFPEPRIHLN